MCDFVLQFDDITDERLVNESQKLKLFREAVLSTAGSHRSVNSRNLKVAYRRIPKVTALVTLGFCRPKGPLLLGSRYFRVAVTLEWLFVELPCQCQRNVMKILISTGWRITPLACIQAM